MATEYFKKINLQNTINDAAGLVAFDSTGDGNGVIALDTEKDAPRITTLGGYADSRTLGVVRISKEIYDALLKKKDSLKSRRQSNPNGLRAAQQPNPFTKSPSPAVPAVGTKKEPDLTPERPPNFEQFRSRTRKMVAEQKAQ